MSLGRPDTERVWLQCMISALGGITAQHVELDAADSPRRSWRVINRQQAEHAAQVADAALKEWRERYPHDER